MKTGGTTKKITLENGHQTIVKAVDVLRDWASSVSAEAPRVMLNKHCNVCQFRHQCRKLAEELDDLSLLDRMTPKIIEKYHKKGIFTVQQLSYLFRSRRFERENRMRPFDLISNCKPWPYEAKKFISTPLPQLQKTIRACFLISREF